VSIFYRFNENIITANEIKGAKNEIFKAERTAVQGVK
jgi:hypothetical protein